MTHSFVPDEYVVPLTLSGPGFRLEPLGPQHNEADHRAWMSSIQHIHATSGFSTWRWPPVQGMSLEENIRNLRRHADDFERRVGFTYTVLDDEDTVDRWLAADWPFTKVRYRNGVSPDAQSLPAPGSRPARRPQRRGEQRQHR